MKNVQLDLLSPFLFFDFFIFVHMYIPLVKVANNIFIIMGSLQDYFNNNSDIVFAAVVVLVLVLVGVVAFGMGGHILAHRGVGAGAWGAVHIGGPNSGNARPANGNAEGYVDLGKEGYVDLGKEGFRREPFTGSSGNKGVWDFGRQRQVPGYTIMGVQGSQDFDIQEGGHLH